MLQAIFAWTGIDTSAEECARIFNDYGIKSIKSRSPSTAQWDVTSSSPGFFRKGETDAWRRDLTKNQIYLIEATTRDAMMRLGYRPETGTGWSWRRVIVWRALIVQRIRAGLEWRLQRWAERLRQRA